MSRRQKLGQHFLVSQSVAKSIVDAAELTDDDVVLEIGTGRGILVPYLCKKAKKVISIESDKKLYQHSITKFFKISNLVIESGDGFKSNQSFSVFVSNLPYSESRPAIEWLIQKKFSRAVIMVQKEFAEKLLASTKSTRRDRKAISVLANHAAHIEKLMKVTKSNFVPPPKVDSVVLKLVRKQKVSRELIKIVNRIFSYRRKTIHNIFKQFGVLIEESDKRLEELTGDEIIKIAKQIADKQNGKKNMPHQNRKKHKIV